MKRLAKLLTAALLSALVSVNLIAFMQARAMTRFTDGSERTRPPEQLGLVDKLAVLATGIQIPRPTNRRTPKDLHLDFETHNFAKLAGAVLEAWFIPSALERALIVLFHGYAASKSTLLTAAEAFHQQGYPTLLVDFYGSGGSSGSGTTLGVKEADDVAAAVEYARRTWPGRTIILYGFSMGGAAVLRAVAVNKVRVDALIIEATFDSLLNAGRNRFRAMSLPVALLTELLLFWGSVQNGFNMFTHNPADYARAVKEPALILHGEADTRATPDEARRVADAMGTNARLIFYSGVPHMAIVEARPEEWRRDVAHFLDELR